MLWVSKPIVQALQISHSSLDGVLDVHGVSSGGNKISCTLAWVVCILTVIGLSAAPSRYSQAPQRQAAIIIVLLHPIQFVSLNLLSLIKIGGLFDVVVAIV